MILKSHKGIPLRLHISGEYLQNGIQSHHIKRQHQTIHWEYLLQP